MKNDYYILGDKVYIILNKNKASQTETVIDICDLEKANEFPNTWYAKKNKFGVYVCGSPIGVEGRKTSYSLHRWILGDNESYMVDHKDRNPLNNTRSNIRYVTNSQNVQNRSVQGRTKSGVRGVHWDKRSKKWLAHVRKDGKLYNFGSFKTIEEAKEVVEKERKKLLPFSEI